MYTVVSGVVFESSDETRRKFTRSDVDGSILRSEGIPGKKGQTKKRTMGKAHILLLEERARTQFRCLGVSTDNQTSNYLESKLAQKTHGMSQSIMRYHLEAYCHLNTRCHHDLGTGSEIVLRNKPTRMPLNTEAWCAACRKGARSKSICGPHETIQHQREETRRMVGKSRIYLEY